jgi:site-specific recombinase XerD
LSFLSRDKYSFQTVKKAYYLSSHSNWKGFSHGKTKSQDQHTKHCNFTVARRYLTEREVERLMNTARKHRRHAHRDSTMILTAYRHGMRASEVCSLDVASDRA